MRLAFTLCVSLIIAISMVRAQQSNTSLHNMERRVCVLGNVRKPSVVSLEGGITLMQAIERAGGALPDMKSNGARIYRQSPNDNTQTLIVIDNLRAIERGRAVDLELQPRDVVEVFSHKRKKQTPVPCVVPCSDWLPSIRIL
jgi:hypothetical protein